jgi:hypothetical protein
MDAVTYLKARQRMTDNCTDCGKCPINGANNGKSLACEYFEGEHAEEAVAIVEKWLSEHPPVTYASKMREVFPKFVPSGPNCLAAVLDKTCSEIKCCDQDGCEACWNREYGSLE